jgi:glyoxylase-like metal-dependent hydrolase (beta-lactamase superfamily II)
MKVTDSLYILPLAEKGGEIQEVIYPSLILDEQHGPTLVDTGMPDREGAIEALLKEIGIRLEDIRRIILTHQDLDHVGSAAAIVQASCVEVWAHAAETPYIEGTLRSIRLPPPALLEKLPPAVRAVLEKGAEPLRVDRQLQGGEVLDIAGGLRVIFTPGHTPGHISLYLERDRVLIAADAVTVHEGRVQLPRAPVTPDMPEAKRSIAKLTELDIETLIAYHGGIARGVKDQLRRLVED